MTTRPVLAPRLLAGLAVSLAAGVATSFLQTWLPDAFASAANSAGTWCAVAFAVALWCAPSRFAVAVGPASLALLVAGYYLTAGARGFASSPTWVAFWLVAALVVGVTLGLGATWLARADVPSDSLRRAVAIAPIAGVLIGEGAHGLMRLTASTSAAYWGAEVAVGVFIGAWALARRVTTARARLIGVAATLAVAAVTFVGYGG